MQLEVISRLPDAAPRPTPLLFVHGAWHGAWCWDEFFLPYFAQQSYACHALSLHGHGGSKQGKSSNWTPISTYVDNVAEVAAQFETPPVIIAHSMGGFVTQKYLETHSASAAILLASVPPSGIFGWQLRIMRRHPLLWLKATLTFDSYQYVSTPQLAREMFFSNDFPAEILNAYYPRLEATAFRAAFDTLLLDLPDVARIKARQIPVQVLGAADDQIFTPSEVHATACAYGTQAEIFPNMAHDMMVERDWQKVADRIISWLGERGF